MDLKIENYIMYYATASVLENFPTTLKFALLAVRILPPPGSQFVFFAIFWLQLKHGISPLGIY